MPQHEDDQQQIEQHDPNMQGDKETSPSASAGLKTDRRGDVEKCPICGAHVDPDAFHCSTCHNYFCFHCRARLLNQDPQVQCINQDCEYYGKLVCGICDPLHEVAESPLHYAEPEDGYWPAWTVLMLIISAITWFYSSFAIAGWTALIGFVGGGLLMQMLGLNIFGRKRMVEQQRIQRFHTCIRCHQQVKKIDNGRA